MTPGSRTHIAMSKWGGGKHWEFETDLVATDGFGHWYLTPIGTPFSRPGRHHTTEHLHVVLVPRPGLLGDEHPTADWVATFYQAHELVHTYVDITTPAVVTDGTVTCVDLDLDVIRDAAAPGSDDPAGGRVWVDDEDEFAEHQVALGYPPEVIQDALAVCERVRLAVADREPPFDGTADRWLA